MATPHSYHLFETSLGWMGIAWSDAGITRVQIPERDRDASERRLKRLSGDAITEVTSTNLPADIAVVVDHLVRYAAGEAVDFSGIAVDLSGVDPFQLAIYDAARQLGFGETVTYGGLAAAAGYPGEARDTGQALGKNPVPIIVPCHRIVAAGGKIGGFSAPGGSRTKEKLLAMEGVHAGPPPPAQAAFGF